MFTYFEVMESGGAAILVAVAVALYLGTSNIRHVQTQIVDSTRRTRAATPMSGGNELVRPDAPASERSGGR